jgi:hypothetical protein
MNIPNYKHPSYSLSAEQIASARHLLSLPRWRRRQLLREAPGAPPKFIYKYLSFNADQELSLKKVRDLIVESRLWLSRPSSFNDPYDFSARIEVAQDPVARRREFERSAKRVLRRNPQAFGRVRGGRNKKVDELARRAMHGSIKNPEGVQQAFFAARDRNGVACFCESPRNLVMWAHYAAGHTGICLQFDVVEDPGLLLLAQRVKYRQSLPHLQWPGGLDKIVDDVLLNKGEVWKEEKEWRCISMTTIDADLPFYGSALTGVMLGARFPPRNKPLLAELLLERAQKRLKAPKIYRATPLRHDYGIKLSAESI